VTRTDPVCSRCGRPVIDDGYLCASGDVEHPGCTEQVTADLRDVPTLARAAADTYAGQDHTTRVAAGPSQNEADADDDLALTAKIQTLPWDERASVALRELRNVLVGWVRLVMEERRYPSERTTGPWCLLCIHTSCRAARSPSWPADSLPAMAGWLIGEVRWLRRHPDAASMYHDITHAVGRIRQVVDRAPNLVYAGPCGALVGADTAAHRCGADMYATPGAAVVTCQACRTHHDVEQRRDWMRDALKEYLLTATEIARAMTSPSQEVRADRIWQWASRGRLVSRGTDSTGRLPLYRVGDVQELLAEHEIKESRRARMRALRAS
jgi:hypothetical protein